MDVYELLLNQPDVQARTDYDQLATTGSIPPSHLIKLPSIHLPPLESVTTSLEDVTLSLVDDVPPSLFRYDPIWHARNNDAAGRVFNTSGFIIEQAVSTVVTNKSSKNAVPLSGVLNADSPDSLAGGRSKKRKRSQPTDETRTLPKPSSPKGLNSRKHQPQPLLPPLLAPLYEPPPNARLVPSINTESASDNFNITSFLSRLDCADEEVEADPPIDAEPEPALHEEDSRPEPGVASKEPVLRKKKRKKRRWSEAETKDLLHGVAKHGIGSWKKILAQSEYQFDHRTAVDLKDRFRICHPEQYVKKKINIPENTSENPAVEARADDTNRAEAKEGDTGALDAIPSLAITYPKRSRRERVVFTDAEDDALLKGFQRHQAQWKIIRLDPELKLSHRSRTDLRDRFRNKFTKEFLEAGYKTTKQPAMERTSGESAAGERTAMEEASSKPDTMPRLSPTATRSSRAAQVSVSALLETPQDVFSSSQTSDTLRQGAADTDIPASIVLSRDIFDWADAHSTRIPHIDWSAPEVITHIEQYDLNPLLALPPMTSSTTMASTASIIAPFSYPTIQLADILNNSDDITHRVL